MGTCNSKQQVTLYIIFCSGLARNLVRKRLIVTLVQGQQRHSERDLDFLEIITIGDNHGDASMWDMKECPK